MPIRNGIIKSHTASSRNDEEKPRDFTLDSGSNTSCQRRLLEDENNGAAYSKNCTIQESCIGNPLESPLKSPGLAMKRTVTAISPPSKMISIINVDDDDGDDEDHNQESTSSRQRAHQSSSRPFLSSRGTFSPSRESLRKTPAGPCELNQRSPKLPASLHEYESLSFREKSRLGPMENVMIRIREFESGGNQEVEKKREPDFYAKEQTRNPTSRKKDDSYPDLGNVVLIPEIGEEPWKSSETLVDKLKAISDKKFTEKVDEIRYFTTHDDDLSLCLPSKSSPAVTGTTPLKMHSGMAVVSTSQVSEDGIVTNSGSMPKPRPAQTSSLFNKSKATKQSLAMRSRPAVRVTDENTLKRVIPVFGRKPAVDDTTTWPLLMQQTDEALADLEPDSEPSPVFVNSLTDNRKRTISHVNEKGHPSDSEDQPLSGIQIIASLAAE
ncbi:hypothetical protein BG004_007111, partial [Podila humilis]